MVRSPVALWAVIGPIPLPSTILALMTWTTRSPSTETSQTIHPFVSHILNFLTLLHQHLKLSNSQG
ncbi:hypothetical protein A2U01_0077239, partial [Trifolium medium]|nr:hypothetical protein [Trifolium medium]